MLITIRTTSKNKKGKAKCVIEFLKKLQNIKISVPDINTRLCSAEIAKTMTELYADRVVILRAAVMSTSYFIMFLAVMEVLFPICEVFT